MSLTTLKTKNLSAEFTNPREDVHWSQFLTGKAAADRWLAKETEFATRVELPNRPVVEQVLAMVWDHTAMFSVQRVRPVFLCGWDGHGTTKEA